MITLVLICLLLVTGLSFVWVSVSGLARLERQRDAIAMQPVSEKSGARG